MTPYRARRAALIEMGISQEPSCQRAFLEALNDPYPQVRAAAITACENTFGAAAIEMLAEHLVFERFVPAGPFIMGNDESPQARPERRVDIGSYYIDRFPVTNADWQRFAEEMPDHPRPDDWVDDKPPPNRQQHPVVYLPWSMAAEYATWSGRRLPTDAEWEKAARGGLTLGFDDEAVVNPDPRRIYPWVGGFSSRRCNTAESGIGGTTPVGAYTQLGGDSPYGVCDLAGNVWEWVSDFFYDDDDDDAGISNRRLREAGIAHLLRGGSWYNEAALATTSYRLPDVYPSARFPFDGFRAALSSLL